MHWNLIFKNKLTGIWSVEGNPLYLKELLAHGLEFESEIYLHKNV